MTKLTLLEYTQDILNDIDGDEVNSIDDTAEATQVAQIVKSTYFALMTTRDWAFLRKPIQLQSSGNTEKPTHVTVVDDIKSLDFINYNSYREDDTRDRYTKMKWKEPEEFLQMTNGRNRTEDNILEVEDDSGVKFLLYTDRAPTSYTSFDDRNLIFDAVDYDVESTLITDKFQAMAYVMPDWSSVDDFVPDLPEYAITAVLEEAKSRAAIKIRQLPDEKAEQEAGRQSRWLSRKQRRVNGGIRYPNYGRKSSNRRQNPYFDKHNSSPEE